MTALQMVLLVLAILGSQAVVWIVLLTWMQRRSSRFAAALRDELAATGERSTRGPEPVLYRGGTGPFPVVKGNGVLVLTDRRLLFRKLVGEGVELPLEKIIGLRQDKWFLRSYRAGRQHLIVKTPEGEVGFIFNDHSSWMETMRTAAARRLAT